MKHKTAHPLIRTREKSPIPFPTKDGIELRCPFCDDRHKLLPNVESPCGTRIEVTAIQEVYSPVLVRKENLMCAKCHKSGGEMVRFRNTYVHTANCTPEVKLLNDIPNSSPLAKVVFKLPVKLRKTIEKRFNVRADQVLEIDEKGNKTGKVTAYVFWTVSKSDAKPSAKPA